MEIVWNVIENIYTKMRNRVIKHSHSGLGEVVSDVENKVRICGDLQHLVIVQVIPLAVPESLYIKLNENTWQKKIVFCGFKDFLSVPCNDLVVEIFKYTFEDFLLFDFSCVLHHFLAYNCSLISPKLWRLDDAIIWWRICGSDDDITDLKPFTPFSTAYIFVRPHKSPSDVCFSISWVRGFSKHFTARRISWKNRI